MQRTGYCLLAACYYLLSCTLQSALWFDGYWCFLEKTETFYDYGSPLKGVLCSYQSREHLTLKSVCKRHFAWWYVFQGHWFVFWLKGRHNLHEPFLCAVVPLSESIGGWSWNRTNIVKMRGEDMGKIAETAMFTRREVGFTGAEKKSTVACARSRSLG